MDGVIRTAFDRDVTFFDTAEAFDPHEAERILLIEVSIACVLVLPQHCIIVRIRQR